MKHDLPDPAFFTAPFFFYSSNQSKEFLYASPSVEQVMGYSPSELIGRRCVEFLDQTSSLNANAAMMTERRFKGDGNHTFLRVVETNDRKLKILKVQTYGLKDENNIVIANHALAQDVTNIYFAEEELNDRWRQLCRVEEKMSEREKHVLNQIIDGVLNKVIAKQLNIGERSVEKIRSRLVEKFEVESMSEVVSKATELKMLTDVILLAHDSHDSSLHQVNLLASRIPKTDFSK